MLPRRTFLTSVAAAVTFGAAGRARAKQPWFYSHDGAVIRGYDVVSYFTDGKPAKGDRSNAVMWKGAMWYFSSQKNRSAFEMNPMAYAPQYGGYCAWAVSRGYTASVAPEAWQIVDNKLYLCYSLSVRDRWSRNLAGNIASGDANWPKVLEG